MVRILRTLFVALSTLKPPIKMAAPNRLETLSKVSKRACDALQPMVFAFYNAINGETAKFKADKSVFTIADGIVQHLLTNCLFTADKFAGIVGEEDCVVNIQTAPYKVDDLTVPDDFIGLINDAQQAILALASEIHPSDYRDVSVFIDPIDGTREFSTGLGEQCSICIGFSDAAGKPIAGVVYRPITQPATFAMGAVSEGFREAELDYASPSDATGFLTSNGSISPFLVDLMKKMDFHRVPSGGAGNKMLMLLEGKGAAYIQDRGVSRWDTCGAQAILEANGGVLTKLTKFTNMARTDADSVFNFAAAAAAGTTPTTATAACAGLESYTYLKSETNLDFEEGAATLTPYNAVVPVAKGAAPTKGAHADFKPYSNICGLLALNAQGLQTLPQLYEQIQAVKETAPPAYD